MEHDEDVTIELFGCCSYEDTWKPGIKGWGATDEESRASGYVSVGDYDALRSRNSELVEGIKRKSAAFRKEASEVSAASLRWDSYSVMRQAMDVKADVLSRLADELESLLTPDPATQDKA
jgi:hypothetical protein